MTTAPPDQRVVRKRADWMTKGDDTILELIRDHGNLTPAAIEKLDGPTSSHASRRCSKLTKAGFLERIVEGLYSLTDQGERYLNEEFDASGIPEPDVE